MTRKFLTHAEHFRWMQEVLAESAFTYAQKAILVRLALHLNLKSGRCDPSVETIAKGAAVKARAVQETTRQAEALGWLIRHEGGGRGNTNSYSLHLRDPHAPAETLHGGAPFEETLHGQTLFGEAQKGAPPRRKPCTAVHPNTENKKNTDCEDDFDRWYLVYPKHRAREKARKAFERIVKAGKATVEQLITGAERTASRWQARSLDGSSIPQPGSTAIAGLTIRSPSSTNLKPNRSAKWRSEEERETHGCEDGLGNLG